MTSQTFLVQKSSIAQTQWESGASAALAPGHIRLRIDVFSFTANNITYASFGDAMKYWDFYPRADSQGVIPVWGFATVTESLCEGIGLGERFYGYFPPANEVMLEPGKVSATGFAITSGARAQLAAVYNQYTRCSADPFYAHGSEAVQCVLRPLFMTSWLIDDFLADNAFFGSEAVMLSSASSKTAYGTAYCLSQRPKSERPRIIGLTSTGNVAFCQSLGCYDEVLTYDQIQSLPENLACTYVDMAGNAALRMQIHSYFKQLAYSCAVGGTHVGELGGAKGLPGPKAVLFFAPAQIAKRRTDWGPALMAERLVNAWAGFAKAVASSEPAWVQEQRVTRSGAQAAYAQLLEGRSDPRQAQVWYLNEE
ncbi:MAG: DUF2855 family protein [Brachymonas sp.]